MYLMQVFFFSKNKRQSQIDTHREPVIISQGKKNLFFHSHIWLPFLSSSLFFFCFIMLSVLCLTTAMLESTQMSFSDFVFAVCAQRLSSLLSLARKGYLHQSFKLRPAGC